MPIQFRCPKCQTTGTAEDTLAGTQVRCQQCGALLKLPGQKQQIRKAPLGEVPPAAPPEWVSDRPKRSRRDEEDAYDDERPYRRDDDERRYRRDDDDYGSPPRELSPSWGTVRTGLSIMFWSLVAIIICALVFVVLAVFSVVAIGFQQARQPGQGAEAIMLLPIIGGIAILLAFLVYFIGQCMCCAAPGESQGRGYAIGSIICTVLVVLAYGGMIAWLVSAGGAMAAGRPDFLLGMAGRGFAIGFILFLLVVLVLALVAHILFITFLKTVGRFFTNQNLASSANGYLVVYIIFVVWQVVGNVIQIAMVGGGGRPGPGQEAAGMVVMGVGCVSLILAIVVFIWFLILLSKARETIRRAMTPMAY